MDLSLVIGAWSLGSCCHKWHEAAAGEDAGLGLAGDFVHLIEGLFGSGAEGADEDTAFLELIPQHGWALRGGGGDDDPVERCFVGPAERAVASADNDVPVSEVFQARFGLVS